MGCPNLLSDALLLRARFLMQQGETSTASELLWQSLALCKRNAMNLRLIRITTTFADLLSRIEQPIASRRMANRSMALAKRASYRLEIQRIRALLDRLDRQYPAEDRGNPES